MSRRLRAVAVLAVVAGGWAAAAYFLWRSRVPGDLALPDVDPGDVLGPGAIDRADDYERFLRIDFLLAEAALLAALAVYAAKGARFARESAAGRIGTGMLLAMLGFAVVWLAQLPFGVAALWWERRHGVSRVGYVDWIIESWLGLGSVFLFICLAVLIVMGLAGPLRDRWWILGGPVFVGLALLFAFVFPYLLPDLEPLRDRELAREARRLAAVQATDPVSIRVERVDAFTTAPNAGAAGLGPSRRIILWNTLLDGRFEDDEVVVVLAHELAHHSRDHIWKSVGWYALFALPGAYLLAVATRRRGGMYEPAAVPLSLLVLVVLQLFASPLLNVISRRLETEADWIALESTRDPQAAEDLFRRFTTASLADPSPPGWAYVLHETHPTTVQRIAMAKAWRARQR